MSEIMLKKYKSEKTLSEEVIFKIPETDLYLFKFGSRKAMSIKPQWTSWQQESQDKPEEIWKLDIIVVGSNFDYTIKKFSIQISQLQRIFSYGKAGYEDYDLLEFMQEYDEENVRTKEQFEADFNRVIDEFKK